MKYVLFMIAAAMPLASLADVNVVSYKSVLAQATVEQPVCFGGGYSLQHLQSNPAQKVKQIRVKIAKQAEAGDDVSFLHVDAVLRSDPSNHKPWHAFFICDNSSGRCAVECDGGSVNLWGYSDGTLGVKNNGFVLHGGCGEEEQEIAKTIFLDATKGGDDLFRLARLPSESCKN
jgi:hypothetical protein